MLNILNCLQKQYNLFYLLIEDNYVFEISCSLQQNTLKKLLQKRNDNYIGFEILCHLNKKLLLKTLQKKLFDIVSCPKSLKLPSASEIFCNYVNKNYGNCDMI